MTDPLLIYPLESIIIVEGKYDYDFLNQAFKIIAPNIELRVTYLEILEGENKGGIDELLNYILGRKNAIKSRQKNAPIFVLLDWDSKNKKHKFEKNFNQEDPFRVFVWDEASCNPKLDQSFKGIERVFSDRIIEEAEELGAPIARTKEGVRKIAPHDKSVFKKKCNEIVLKGINEKDLEFCKDFLKSIVNAIPSQ